MIWFDEVWGPHSRDFDQGQMPHICSAPLPIGLNIDRCITTEFPYAKRDSRCLSLLGFSPCKFWQALAYLSKYLTLVLTHFDKPKNLLELPHPTRNIRKCSNKLMTNTSGEINLQSKQDIICHVAKVKPTTSAHYGAEVIPLLAYVIFPSNPTPR